MLRSALQSRAPRGVPPAAQNLFLKKKVSETEGFTETLQKDFKRFAVLAASLRNVRCIATTWCENSRVQVCEPRVRVKIVQQTKQ